MTNLSYKLKNFMGIFEQKLVNRTEYAFYKWKQSIPKIDQAHVSQQNILNQSLIQTIAMVNAELEAKMKQKALALKLSNLQFTKLRLAEIVPKMMLKQKLLTFNRWKLKVNLIQEYPREPESSITIRTRSQTS